ncbi:hypothetical protein QTP88_018850 [Uroleucon formosanum]
MMSSFFETRPLPNDTAAISNITNEKEVKINEPSVIDTRICLNATSTADEEYLHTSTLDNFEITQNTPIEMTTDIGLWPENVSKYVDYWIKRGIIDLQNCDEELLKEKSFIQKNINTMYGSSSSKCDSVTHTNIKILFYFSRFYTTPDEGYIDQPIVVFRFMEGSKPVENFFKFLPYQGHKTQDMFNSIMKVLENNGIEINNCRSQSYDNESAMSGKYNGLQSKIIAVNEELQQATKKLVAVYDDDLDELLCVEIIHNEFIKLYSQPAEMSNKHFMYKTLIGKDVISAFPNVEIPLRMYLTITIKTRYTIIQTDEAMNKKDVDVCISAQCCCKLIMKCPEKPAPVAVVKPRNPCSERAKNPEMSLCEFLKSQPVPGWIKALQDNRARTKNSKDRPRGPVVAPAPISRICEQPPGTKNPPNHYQDIKQNPIQPTDGLQEDRNMSQIIINIGTIITNGVCKRDSCQQTDSEVQISVSPPVERPTSACPPVERPTSACPPVERPTSNCPPAEKPITVCPPVEKRTSVCPPAERPTAVILPKVRSPVVGSIPLSQDLSCRYQGNTPSTIPSKEPKPCNEPKIKFKLNCCCTCHSDV